MRALLISQMQHFIVQFVVFCLDQFKLFGKLLDLDFFRVHLGYIGPQAHFCFHVFDLFVFGLRVLSDLGQFGQQVLEVLLILA